MVVLKGVSKKRFINFEGIDFCGKTTQIKLVMDYLKESNIPHSLYREPGGTLVSEQIRSILLDKDNFNMTKETETLLYSAARSQVTTEKIIPDLKKGNVVLADRF